MTCCESGICLPVVLSFSSNFRSRNLCSSTDEKLFFFFLKQLGNYISGSHRRPWDKLQR